MTIQEESICIYLRQHVGQAGGMQVSAPTESPKRFPNRSFPRRCRGSPLSCCLSNVCRRPRPRSRLPVRVAVSRPRQVKAAQEVGRSGVGALVLALTGVAYLSSRTGGFYPLLGAGETCASAGSAISA